MTAGRDAWSGRVGFILATVGSAVGTGSIWKFPYEVGANGGSAFILLYVLGLVLIVVPLLFAEFAVGRRGRADPQASIAAIAAGYGASRRWAIVGTLGVLTGFLILSFYAVIGGWTLAYTAQTALGGLPGSEPQSVQARYDALLASPLEMLGYHVLFMAATAAIVARGIAAGIEAACKVLMPLLAALMVLLATYAMVEGDAAAALHFLLKLDPQRLTAGAAIDALGLGFFSIGVGLGLMITYAAYSGAEVNLKEVAVASVVADTAISLLAGLAVFPIVFAHGLDPAYGPGLVFVTLPLAFAQMRFGTVAGVGFFVLLFVAALRAAARGGDRGRRGDLLGGWNRHRALVQPLGGLASARGLARLRTSDGLRPARLPDLQCPAAARRAGDRALRRLGGAGRIAHRRAAADARHRPRIARPAPLRRTAGDRRYRNLAVPARARKAGMKHDPAKARVPDGLHGQDRHSEDHRHDGGLLPPDGAGCNDEAERVHGRTLRSMAPRDGVVARRQRALAAEPVQELIRRDEDGRSLEPRIDLPIEERIGAAVDEGHGRPARAHAEVGGNGEGASTGEDLAH